MFLAISIVFSLFNCVNGTILLEPLLFFAPFDIENGHTDITMGNYSILMDDFCVLETSKTGPFGLVNSSYTISSGEGFIGLYKGILWTHSFTIFAYTFVADWYETGSIISTSGFSINSIGNSLEMVRLGNGNVIDSFTISNFFNGWTLVCLVYNNDNKSVSFFNRNGIEIYRKFNFEIIDWEDSFLLIGGGFRNASILAMHEQDAIANVMIYGRILEVDEIQQVHHFLATNHNVPTVTVYNISNATIVNFTNFYTEQFNDTWRVTVSQRKHNEYDKTFVNILAIVLVVYFVSIVTMISIGIGIDRFSKSGANRNVQGPYRQVHVE